MSRPTPPRLASWLLALFAGDDDRRFVLFDLREEFEAHADERGVASARRWYWRQAMASAAPLLAGRLRHLDPGRLLRALRHSARVLRASLGATAIAVITLALGIGANTAVFSVVDAVLLRPLPYQNPERLVAVWQTRAGARTTVSAGDYADYLTATNVFESLGAYVITTRVLSGGPVPEEAQGDVVTWNLFPLLGAHSARGREFIATDARPGAEPTVILSDATWRTVFGSDPAIVGRTMLLSGAPHTVIGVMPAGFPPPSGFLSSVPAAFFMPAPEVPLGASRADHDLQVIGRLRPGVTAVQAQRELERIDAVIAQQHPDTNHDTRAAVAPLEADITRGVRVSLLVVLGCVGLVVLIAAVNVANLLIVKAIGQRREVAIRVALGAGRGDIIVDYLIRGLTLAFTGAACGLVCGTWARDLLASAAPASIPRLDHLMLSPRILIATTALTVLSGLLAGIIPALQVLHEGHAGNIRIVEQSSSGTRAVRRWQGVLLAVEIAAAVVIASAAGLLVKSVLLLNRVQLGFDTDRVLTFRLGATSGRPDPAARFAFFRDVSDRIARIPGIQSVAFANNFPMRGGWDGPLQVLTPSGAIDAEADLQAVSDTYFTTLGVPLVRGRLFNAADRIGAPLVVIVSETFATRLLAGREPIGSVIRRNPATPPLTIVGVVGEIRRDGKFVPPNPQVFFPAAQIGTYAARLEMMAVRTERSNPRTLLPTIRQAIAAVDPAQPLSNVHALDEVLQASVGAWRFNMLLLSAFATLALTLATVGVYGIVSHAAIERTREIGIRSALGATRISIIRLVVGSALRWAVPGLGAGLAIALVLARLMTTMLFGVAPTDISTFAVVSSLTLVAATFASYLPAGRAAAADPIRALRID